MYKSFEKKEEEPVKKKRSYTKEQKKEVGGRVKIYWLQMIEKHVKIVIRDL